MEGCVQLFFAKAFPFLNLMQTGIAVKRWKFLPQGVPEKLFILQQSILRLYSIQDIFKVSNAMQVYIYSHSSWLAILG